MPRVTFSVTRAGLAVAVWVGLDGKTSAALQAAGRPIPAPVRARGLLDTCADVTAIASWVIRQLAIAPATTATTQTAGGVVAVNLYEMSLSIADPGPAGGLLVTHPGLVVSELSVGLPDADVLVGLDLLLEGKLLLDGPARQFTLEY
jgi:hypothetical protein